MQAKLSWSRMSDIRWKTDIADCGCFGQIFRMFRNGQFDRVRQAFADQFSSDERGFIFRKYQKGPPIRVTEVERDEFVRTFNKRICYTTWSIFPATIGLIVLLVWLVPDDSVPAAQAPLWVGLAAILMPFVVSLHLAWNAPDRQLASRTPEGVALTTEEARALALSKITYGHLALAALMGTGLVWKMSRQVDVFHGWGMIWLVVGAALILFAGVQAIRKWRLSQQ